MQNDGEKVRVRKTSLPVTNLISMWEVRSSRKESQKVRSKTSSIDVQGIFQQPRILKCIN